MHLILVCGVFLKKKGQIKFTYNVYPLYFVLYSLQKLICLRELNDYTFLFVFLQCFIENEEAAKLDYMLISFASAT